jgi:ATP-dependent Lhr-like helicase
LEHFKVIDLIDPRLQRLIKEKGWTSGLTDIQKEAIPVLLEGTDCIIEAPTAGGKTEAVFFPTLTKAASRKKDSVQVLYLAPLRALLNDIENRAKEYASTCGLQCFKWHGDVSQRNKIEAIQQPPNILLTTPESLEAILLRKSEWTRSFQDLQTIIIDEAHNFASSDRGSHIVSILERLESQINKKPQRIALSATIGNPSEMLKWLAGGNRAPGKRITVQATKEKEKDYQIQYFLSENKQEKDPAYLRLIQLFNLHHGKKSLVFSKSRKKAEQTASAIHLLNKHLKGLPVKVRTHHSSVSKFYREDAEERIKIRKDLESGLDGIISTTTLELGIDIGELDQVIQMDALSSSSAFLQRVGRTGRRPGNPQFFRGLIIEEEDLIVLSAVVNLGLKGKSENILFPQKAFHILAHQLICLSLQNYGVSKQKAWQILSNAYCFSKIDYHEFEALVDYMVNHEFFRNVDGELVIGEATEKYFLSYNWKKLFAVFESGPLYEVIEEKNHVGTLDEAFVESLETPFYFILGGIEWEAFKVKEKTKQVFARKTRAGNAPKWQTFSGLEVPYQTAQEAGSLLFSDSNPNFLNTEAKECFESLRLQYKKLNWKNDQWLIGEGNNNVTIWTFAGERINRTLVKLIEANNFGNASANYKHVTVKPKQKGEIIDIQSLLEFLTDLNNRDSEDFQQILEKSIRPAPFTKFTRCLPDNLLRKTIVERSFDLEGLVEEVRRKDIRLKHF